MAKKPSECWICGKPVSVDEAGMDEFGVPVHMRCKHDWDRPKKPVAKSSAQAPAPEKPN